MSPNRSCTGAREGLRRRLAASLVLGLCGLFAALLAASATAQDEEADRDFWVKRYETLKAEVAELEVRVETLEGQYTRARRRNYPRGEPLQQIVTDLEEARVEYAEKKEEWENFPDEARRAGALPGWFRD